MSKVHLIKDCYACIYRWCDLCIKAGTRIDIDTYKDFPDWCPLPDLPERKDDGEIVCYGDGEPITETLANSLMDFGFNECLDEIIREGKS